MRIAHRGPFVRLRQSTRTYAAQTTLGLLRLMTMRNCSGYIADAAVMSRPGESKGQPAFHPTVPGLSLLGRGIRVRPTQRVLIDESVQRIAGFDVGGSLQHREQSTRRQRLHCSVMSPPKHGVLIWAWWLGLVRVRIARVPTKAAPAVRVGRGVVIRVLTAPTSFHRMPARHR